MTAPPSPASRHDDGSSALHASTAMPSTSGREHRDISSPLKAIGWAFLGIRSSDARERDAARMSPLLWIGVGIGAVVVFVLVLMAAVHWLVPTIS